MTEAASEPDAPAASEPDALGPAEVVVYWRPGCPFCSHLRRRLARAGLTPRERDIWADADAAAFVRAHASGDETVPTVAIGETVLVNPTSAAVLAAARQAGVVIDAPPRRWWQRA